MFFDTPGPPWTNHDATCHSAFLEELLESRGNNKSVTLEAVEKYARERGLAIPEFVLKRLAHLGRAPLEPVPSELKATVGATYAGSAKVLEVRKINLAKRVGLIGPMAEKLLGRHQKTEYLECLLRTVTTWGASNYDIAAIRPAYSVPPGLTQGKRAHISLRAECIAGVHWFWILEALHVLK